jgi:hypothetical protein
VFRHGLFDRNINEYIFQVVGAAFQPRSRLMITETVRGCPALKAAGCQQKPLLPEKQSIFQLTPAAIFHR